MQKIIIIKISQSVKDSTNKKRFEMIFLCRIRGHGFLSREERYYGKWTLKWWVRVIYVCLSSFLCAFNRWGKSALNFYMHVRLGLRFHSNKVFHLLFCLRREHCLLFRNNFKIWENCPEIMIPYFWNVFMHTRDFGCFRVSSFGREGYYKS